MKKWSAFRFRKLLEEKSFHCHPTSQLFLVAEGYLQLRKPSRTWAIPKGRLVWIAPKVLHSARSSNLVEGWSAYLDAPRPFSPNGVCILKSSKFLTVLLERLAESKLPQRGKEVTRALTTLITHELKDTKTEDLGL